jgi:hypothetical protein
MEVYSGKIDGVFGKGTKSSLCSSLRRYTAIGGKGENGGINAVSDVNQYIDWLYSALNVNETGGEFPE